MKYKKRFVDEEEWKEISKEEMIERIGGYYQNAESIVSQMEQGDIPSIRTPWAYFKVESLG